jgi:hypothetical protein
MGESKYEPTLLLVAHVRRYSVVERGVDDMLRTRVDTRLDGGLGLAGLKLASLVSIHAICEVAGPDYHCCQPK